MKKQKLFTTIMAGVLVVSLVAGLLAMALPYLM